VFVPYYLFFLFLNAVTFSIIVSIPTTMAMLNDTIDKLTWMFTKTLPKKKLVSVKNGPLSPLKYDCNMTANYFKL